MGSLDLGMPFAKLDALEFRFGWKLGLGWGQGVGFGFKGIQMGCWSSDVGRVQIWAFRVGWGLDSWGSDGLDRSEVRIGWDSNPWTPDGLGFESGGFEWSRVRIQAAQMG